MLIALGSTGIGLVWGWLLAFIGGRRSGERPLRNGLSLVAATAALTFQLYLYSGRQTLPIFLGATTLSLLAHSLWQRQLRQQA